MAARSDAAALTDLIHGALYGESSWQDFLERARLLLPNGHAVLFFHEAATGAIPLSAGSDPDTITAYNDHYSTVNPWMPHATMRPLGRVIQADEMLRRDDLKATEYYNDYLKPQDIHTGIGLTIKREKGCNSLFSVVCADIDEAEAAAAKATLQAQVPHLRRAFDYYSEVSGPWNHLGRSSGAAKGTRHSGPGARVLFADSQALRLAEESGCLSVNLFGRLSCTSAITEYLAAELSV